MLMKWIFVLGIALIHSPLWAAEQYTEAQCGSLKQQQEQIRKRMNAGYSFSEGNWLNKRDRELFQQIASHCTTPVTQAATHSESDIITSYQSTDSTNSKIALQDMPAWSGRNAIFEGDKAAAWAEFYQVPTRCRQKQLSEVDFVACADHKALQRLQFEQRWQKLKFVPLTTGTAQATAARTERQPVLQSIPAYTMEPTIPTSSTRPAAQHSTSRYVENIQQQFHWVGMAFIVVLAVGSWLIWRK
jgi:hypothetical protein